MNFWLDQKKLPDSGSRISWIKWDNQAQQLYRSAVGIVPIPSDVLRCRITVKNQAMPVAKWPIIERALTTQRLENPEDIETAIRSYQPKLQNFTGLAHYLVELHPNRRHLFSTVIPALARIALSLPQLFPHSLPTLKSGHNISVTLSHQQILCLMANAFFCTFSEPFAASVPGINFANLNQGMPRTRLCGPVSEAKLHCLFEYFSRRVQSCPVGYVTFHRRFYSHMELPSWHELRNTPICYCDIRVLGRIEDEGQGMLQVDFANKYIGGGVLRSGAVQEEILFCIMPELIVTRLFVEELGPSETVFMIGSERMSNYVGCANQFEWDSSCSDTTQRDAFGRLRTEIVAMDAIHFRSRPEQYRKAAILRELNKAYAGFQRSETSPLPMDAPIATGNWGCGAFNGDPELKFLIQLMAASAASRSLLYFTFGDDFLASKFVAVLDLFHETRISVSELLELTLSYNSHGEEDQTILEFVAAVLKNIRDNDGSSQAIIF